MREIKFRAWDKEKKEIIEWEDFYQILEYPSVFMEPDDVVVMQYTGLKDKNGKEIYEGDCLRGVASNTDDVFHITQCLPLCRNAWSYIKRVGYFEGKKYHSLASAQTDITYDEILSFSEESEIIGNIYENPDLLASKEEI